MRETLATILWEGWTALVLCAAAVFLPGSEALTYPAVLWPGLVLAAAVPTGWAFWALAEQPAPLPPEQLLEKQNPRIGFPIQRFCSSVDHLICRKSGVLVCTLGHTADLARSGVLLDDTLSASLVDRGNSSQDGCVLVSGIRIDGSVCLLDDCFQVGLNGLVVSLLCSSLHDAVLLRFDVRHSFHLLGYL